MRRKAYYLCLVACTLSSCHVSEPCVRQQGFGVLRQVSVRTEKLYHFKPRTALDFLVNVIKYEVPRQDLRIDYSRLPALPRSRFAMRGVRMGQIR